MRFPWLQVGADVISAKAGDLGVLLGCSRREAMGLLVDLWAWVLTRSPDDAPPDGIVRDSRTGTGAVPATERAVSWAGPEGMLVTALEELGFVERLPDGLCFRGAARYAATWEKNRRRKQTDPKPERNRSGTGDEPARKTQTQTQSSSPSESAASATPARGETQSDTRPFALEIQAPETTKPREAPPGEVLYARLEFVRESECKAAGLPFVPSRWAYSRQNKDLGPIAKLPDGHDEQRRFQAAWVAFLEDPQARDLDEPFSLSFFWRMRSRYEGRGLKAVGS